MKRYAKQLSMNERDLGLRGNPLNSLELLRLSVFFLFLCEYPLLDWRCLTMSLLDWAV